MSYIGEVFTTFYYIYIVNHNKIVYFRFKYLYKVIIEKWSIYIFIVIIIPIIIFICINNKEEFTGPSFLQKTIHDVTVKASILTRGKISRPTTSYKSHKTEAPVSSRQPSIHADQSHENPLYQHKDHHVEKKTEAHIITKDHISKIHTIKDFTKNEFEQNKIPFHHDKEMLNTMARDAVNETYTISRKRGNSTDNELKDDYEKH